MPPPQGPRRGGTPDRDDELRPRMGGRRESQRRRSIVGALAKRASGSPGSGGGPRKTRGGGGRRSGTFGPRGGADGGKAQRVTVQVRVVRHDPSTARHMLQDHASYLKRDTPAPGIPDTPGRENADNEATSERVDEASLPEQLPGAALAYTADREGVPLSPAISEWEHDRHHFRMIVSPEHARDMPDLRDYVRDYMKQVEKDLDTKLEWYAVNHYDTDHHHAHVLVRGRDEKGGDLGLHLVRTARSGPGTGDAIAG